MCTPNFQENNQLLFKLGQKWSTMVKIFNLANLNYFGPHWNFDKPTRFSHFWQFWSNLDTWNDTCFLVRPILETGYILFTWKRNVSSWRAIFSNYAMYPAYQTSSAVKKLLLLLYRNPGRWSSLGKTASATAWWGTSGHHSTLKDILWTFLTTTWLSRPQASTPRAGGITVLRALERACWPTHGSTPRPLGTMLLFTM